MSADLIGYTSRFSVAPGEEIQFMIDSEFERADVQLVRLIHGDERSSFGLMEQKISSSLDGIWPLGRQATYPGSFGLIDATLVQPAGLHVLAGHLFVYPTLISHQEPQALLAQPCGASGAGWELVLQGGLLVLRLLQGETAVAEATLPCPHERLWCSVSIQVGLDHLGLWCVALDGPAAGRIAAARANLRPSRKRTFHGPILLAARSLVEDGPEPRARETFNGKLERLTLAARQVDSSIVRAVAVGADPASAMSAVWLDLDLGVGSSGWSVWDRATGAAVGRLYNAPLRGCASHAWKGDTLTPALDPKAHSAVHFHDDDLHHANWRPQRSWRPPCDLASGLYALRLRASEAEDRIPFIVRPPRDRASARRVALWLPSFTYAAYGNARKAMRGRSYRDFHPEESAGDHLLARHPEWGLSAYDVHQDGSGVVISTLSRPIPNLRPTHRVGLTNAPRHLGADLYIVHWLEHLGIAADVFGDEDVHNDGIGLLRRYATVLTGTHPEYVSGAELDAVEEYLDGGGRLMYMGGNGFYWVTIIETGISTTVEIRRGHAGTRTWDAAPGELHHQFTGEPGGLWRHRGRGPHRLVGVGFVSEGWDGNNRPYERSDDSYMPETAWIFDGIAAHEPIGDDGLVMRGAAGDEIDSTNQGLGTPADTVVLASSSGHSDSYWLTVEDVLETSGQLSGQHDPRIHADATLTPKRHGGAVFAAGSMSWSACLSNNNFQNPLARMSENVLKAFSAGSTPWITGRETDAKGAEPLRNDHKC